MTVAGLEGGDQRAEVRPSLIARLFWNRQIDRYPETGPRIFYLGIVIVATIILYYELYVPGGVATEIIAYFHISFSFYVYVTVVANAVGAFSAIIAGLADRWGRSNLVVYGLAVTGLLMLFGLPNAPNPWVYAVLYATLGFVEGIILVATPALVRDYSPQLGRASAMGFWTLGPVVGSLIVAVVASNTLSHLVAWQDQLTICGIVGLGVFVIALVGLRELSPALRDQLMVSIRDRALIEARAKGIDIEKSLQHPWRQMLKPDIILSALAISVFLLIYYTAVAFNIVYFETIFSFSTSQANGLGNWLWGFDALGLILIGVLSDWLKVRKPFMIVGALGAIAMTIVYLLQASNPHTGYYTIAWIFTLLAIFLAVTYAPWMASFTETVERRNPALTATGLAVWGWTLRAVVALSLLMLPFVVSSTTPLVAYGALGKKAQAIEQSDPLVPVVLAHAALFAELQKYPTNAIPPDLLAKAVKEVGLKTLIAVSQDKTLPGKIAFFQDHQAELESVQHAAKVSPGQWQTWYWVCVGAEAFFIPFVFLMAGRWSPARARRDAEEHERQVQAELQRLHAE